jgi:predicted RNA-binding Zn-ribbon protein involved in translation (DUF1610 family)
MGLMLESRCPCGYVGSSALGGGMMDFHQHCAAPALCTACASVVTVELFDSPSICPDCHEEAIPYDRRAVQQLDHPSGSPLADWMLPDGRSFALPGGARFVCTRCAKATMTFEVLGCFD